MRFVFLALTIAAMLFVAGCKEAGDALSSLTGGGSSIVSGLAGGGGSGGIGHIPEPATIALIAGGLVAYVLLRRRKK